METLNVYTKGYAFITNRIRASVYYTSDLSTVVQSIIDSVPNHPARTWQFTGLNQVLIRFILHEIDDSGSVVSELANLDLSPSSFKLAPLLSSVITGSTDYQKTSNTIHGIIDDKTGNYISFNKSTNIVGGSSITDADVDNIIIIKLEGFYWKRNCDGYTPEMFGAVGDGVTNDSPPLQLMANSIIKFGTHKVELGSRYNYRIMSAVNFDYTGKGQLTTSFSINGNGARIYINPTAGNYGFNAFNVLCDNVIHYTSFAFRDISVYTDNVTRPNAFNFQHAYGVLMDSVTIKDASTGIFAFLAADMKITHCNITGCLSGVILERMRDTYVIGATHINACGLGLWARGMNSAELDGNVNFDHIVVNQCVHHNIVMTGLYSPILNNVETELAGEFNLLIQSCNYGSMDNVTCGPGGNQSGPNGGVGFQVVTPSNSWDPTNYPNGLTNDWWRISNLQTQNRVKFQALFNSSFVNLNLSNYGNMEGNASMIFDNCFDICILNFICKVSANPIPGQTVNYSVGVNANCGQFTVNGFNTDLPLKLNGTVSTRGGVHDWSGMKINSLTPIVTDDSTSPTFKNNENFRYMNLSDSNKAMVSIVNGIVA